MKKNLKKQLKKDLWSEEKCIHVIIMKERNEKKMDMKKINKWMEIIEHLERI